MESISVLSPHEIQKPLFAAGIDQSLCKQLPGFYYDEFSNVGDVSGERIANIKEIFESLGFEIPGNYIFSQVSQTLLKPRKLENKRYRNIREYDDEFGDFWPINSIDIGVVMIH